MKKLFKLSPFFFSIVILFTLTTCDYFFGDENETECDKTAFSSTKTYKVSFSIMLMSTVYDDYTNLVTIPLQGEQIKIEFHKKACGLEGSYTPGGSFEFTGVTDSFGEFDSGGASYQVRNGSDAFISIISHRPHSQVPWEEIHNEHRLFRESEFNKNTLLRYEKIVRIVTR